VSALSLSLTRPQRLLTSANLSVRLRRISNSRKKLTTQSELTTSEPPLLSIISRPVPKLISRTQRQTRRNSKPSHSIFVPLDRTSTWSSLRLSRYRQDLARTYINGFSSRKSRTLALLLLTTLIDLFLFVRTSRGRMLPKFSSRYSISLETLQRD